MAESFADDDDGGADVVFRRAVIPPELAGKRLDQAAAALIPEFSRSRLKAWIDAGCITLAGEPAEAKRKVRAGDELVLAAELEAAVPVRPEPIPLTVVYEDPALLVVDKPAGLIVHPGAGNPSGTLQNALLHLDPALAALPRAGLVHRLDKDTSGLLLVARTLEAQAALAARLERREIRRTYVAVCQGVLTGGGVVDAPIGRHPRDRLKQAVTGRGRAARTHYRVLERFRAHTSIEVELETGRTHQIRVHMAHLRAPLVGDPLYGGRPRFPPQPTEGLRALLETFGRQALHAARLALRHPGTGEPLSFESALPADMEALLAALRADAAAAAGRGRERDAYGASR
ncbi:MAG TPA: 23S rRNA pseudouridine(1911/1915/1917) synthase RluD [Gammaproteobacteria bacterium]